MATLKTQYENYLRENPESSFSYQEWMDKVLVKWFENSPVVSDNFQIGPDGAFEYSEDELEDQKIWDSTLLDGLEDEDWNTSYGNGFEDFFKN